MAQQLKDQDFNTVEDLMDLSPDDVDDYFHKPQLLSVRLCLALKKAISKLQGDDAPLSHGRGSGPVAAGRVTKAVPATFPPSRQNCDDFGPAAGNSDSSDKRWCLCLCLCIHRPSCVTTHTEEAVGKDLSWEEMDKCYRENTKRDSIFLKDTVIVGLISRSPVIATVQDKYVYVLHHCGAKGRIRLNTYSLFPYKWFFWH